MRFAPLRGLSLTVAVLAAVLVTHAGLTSGGAATSASLNEASTQRSKVFPVARSDWYSVINFSDDWLAPRMRLIDGEWRQVGVHEGNDIFAEPGTPVRAVTGGVLERVGWLFYSGWRVGIRGDDGRYWFYAHLSESPENLSEGQRVEAGDRIGSVGNTGYGQRPGHRDEFVAHLHLGVQRPSGEWVNPYPLMKRLYEDAVDQ